MDNKKTNNNPTRIFTVLWQYRHLIYQLTKRDILTKYRGSFAGLLWALLSPLLMLGLYTIVFGVFMHAKWPGVDDQFMFALMIYVGLIIFGFFSECISRAPSMIVNNPNFVKKMIFPVEIYPWIIVGSALFQACINIFILALFCFFLLGKIYITILFLPLLFLPLILITLGLCWFFCSVGVFVRDISFALPIILQLTMYLSCIFYARSSLPQEFQSILLCNPLTYLIEETRNIVVYGQVPEFYGLGIYLTVSFCFAWLGFFWFEKTKDGFADVL